MTKVTAQGGRPLNFGHRGALTYAPENTLAAFQKAKDLGADGVELDVSLSADGEVVVCHDDTVDRTTQGQGHIAKLSLAEIKTLDAGSWFSPEFAGVQIPTLEEVVDWAADGMLLNIELKARGIQSDGLEAQVAAIVHKHGAEKRVLVSSFNPLVLRRFKNIAPEVQTGLLYARGLPFYVQRTWFLPLGRTDALHPHFSAVNESYMRWARARGYRVHVWAPREATDLEWLVRLRVDMIITDRPDLLAAVLATG